MSDDNENNDDDVDDDGVRAMLEDRIRDRGLSASAQNSFHPKSTRGASRDNSRCKMSIPGSVVDVDDDDEDDADGICPNENDSDLNDSGHECWKCMSIDVSS